MESKIREIITKQPVAIIYMDRILFLNEVLEVYRVRLATTSIKMYERQHAKAGEMNHDRTITPNFFQARCVKPVEMIPAPKSAPMTVCVPEIGIPENEEVMINVNDARHTENMIFFYSNTVKLLMLGMMSLDKVAVTSSAQNIAPMNSAIAPIMISLYKLSAFDP